MNKIIIAFVLLVVSFVNQGISQSSISIVASQDASIDAFLSNTNKGSSTYLESYPWGSSYSRRFLLKFDLTNIPSGATILSAKVKLTMYGTNGIQRTIESHPITTAWNESSVTWANFGSQFSASTSSSTVVWPSNTIGEWDVKNDLQLMIDGGLVNHGWLFMDSNESDWSQQYWFFNSKENVSGKPVLEVTYETGAVSSLNVISEHINTSCNGIDDGSAIVNVTGGSGSYSYSWSPSPGSGQSTSTVNGLSPGLWTVIVSDNNDPLLSENVQIQISEPMPVSGITSSINSNCFSCNDGVINVTGNGGDSPFQYAINSETDFTSVSSFDNLNAGNHSILIKDANGCLSDNQNVDVGYNGLSIQYIVQGTGSNQDNGAIDITISGGKAPYTAIWSNGATQEDLVGLSGGVYSLIVKGDDGETKEIDISVETAATWESVNNGVSGANGSFTNTNGSWGVIAEGITTSRIEANKDGEIILMVNSISDYNHQWSFGLSSIEATNTGVVEFAVKNWTGGGYDIYKGNIWQGTSGISGSVGDVIKVKREGSLIHFFVNDLLIPVSTVTSDPSKELVGNVILYAANASISNTSLNFGTETTLNHENFLTYHSLQNELGGDYGNTENNKLNFYYKEKYKLPEGSSLNFSITSNSGLEVLGSSTIQFPIKYGGNKVSIDVSGLSSGMYLLQILNAQNEKSYLNFKKD